MKSQSHSGSNDRRLIRRTIGLVAACLLGSVGLAASLQSAHAWPTVSDYSYELTLTHTDKQLGEAYQQQQDDPCVLGDESCKSPADWYYAVTSDGGQAQTIDKWSFGTPAKNSPTNLHQWQASGYLNGKLKEEEVGPFYTYEQLTNVLTCGLIGGCAPAAPADSIGFFIGIDTNGSSVPQHLYLFEIWECPFPLENGKTNKGDSNCKPFAIFLDSDRTDSFGPNLNDPDTGTGWTNYILTASGMAFSKDHIYAFHARYDQNGGADSFFLINEGTLPCVPGPENNNCGQVPLPGTLLLLGAGVLGVAGARVRSARRSG